MRNGHSAGGGYSAWVFKFFALLVGCGFSGLRCIEVYGVGSFHYSNVWLCELEEWW